MWLKKTVFARGDAGRVVNTFSLWTEYIKRIKRKIICFWRIKRKIICVGAGDGRPVAAGVGSRKGTAGAAGAHAD